MILILSKCWSLSLNFVYINGNESLQRKHFLASSAPSYFQLAFSPSPHLGSVPQMELQLELISIQFSLVFETLGIIVEMVVSLRQQED